MVTLCICSIVYGVDAPAVCPTPIAIIIIFIILSCLIGSKGPG